jgi:hypothetical protein
MRLDSQVSIDHGIEGEKHYKIVLPSHPNHGRALAMHCICVVNVKMERSAQV